MKLDATYAYSPFKLTAAPLQREMDTRIN